MNLKIGVHRVGLDLCKSGLGAATVRDRFCRRGTMRPTDDSALIFCNLALRRATISELREPFKEHLVCNEENVLLEQAFVIDQEKRVGKVVEDAAKTAGAPIRVAQFVRFSLGEGIERPPSDFAAEVGAQLKN